jgi:hypothetical protein
VSEKEDVPILVCIPVYALATPEAGSVQSVCQTCEQPVWVSVHGMAFLRENPKIFIACNNCAIEAIGSEEFGKEGKMVPGVPEWMPKALEELRSRYDLSDLLRVKDLDEP